MLPNTWTNISCEKLCPCHKTTSHWGVETPNFHAQRHFFFSQGGKKFPGTVSLRLCVAAAECRRREGGLKKKNEKEVEEKGEEDEKRKWEIEETDQRGEGENSSRARSELNS